MLVHGVESTDRLRWIECHHMPTLGWWSGLPHMAKAQQPIVQHWATKRFLDGNVTRITPGLPIKSHTVCDSIGKKRWGGAVI